MSCIRQSSAMIVPYQEWSGLSDQSHQDSGGVPQSRAGGDERPEDCVRPPAEQVDQWLEEAKRGSAEALGKLLSAAQAYLLRISQRSLSEGLKGKDAHSDIVQSTSLEAIRDFSSFSGTQYGELLRWLRRILLNNIANANRHFERTQKRQVSREVYLVGLESTNLELTDKRATAEESVLADELRQAVEEAVMRLPPAMRSAILLRNREHLSFAEIGDRLNRSAEAARKLWARGIERLQSELE